MKLCSFNVIIMNLRIFDWKMNCKSQVKRKEKEVNVKGRPCQEL